MAVSLRTFWEHCQRKGDRVDPAELSASEIAGLLHGTPAVIEKIEGHMAEHPNLWELGPNELMRRLALLPGVGRASAAWWVLNELQVGQRIAQAQASDDAPTLDDVA